eukprot:COSAG02_NODE_34_length_49821_cov_105.420438_45_plen_51_part_00
MPSIESDDGVCSVEMHDKESELESEFVWNGQTVHTVHILPMHGCIDHQHS